MTDLIEGKHLSPFKIFPAKPGTCSECAVDHDENQPHNRDSLFYQYHFFNEHGIWPKWGDAMAHCDEKTKQYWKSELMNKGVKESEFDLSKALKG